MLTSTNNNQLLQRSLVTLNPLNNTVQQPIITQVGHFFSRNQRDTKNESVLGAYSTTYRSSYTNQGGNRGGPGSSGMNGGQGANYSKYV